jgi:hypothetical protein
VERYSDPQSFAREVNLPLIGAVHVPPVPAAAPAAAFLAADDPDEMRPVVDLLTQTRKSLTLRSLFLTGFPHDPEFFAAGVALARQWTRQGLRVAVVDLDYRHPTVVRPRPHPNEGFVDALEYGCSFQRIAWELVADALWMVGPGSHPPDERRFSEHPDWTRVMRIFPQGDVTLYMVLPRIGRGSRAPSKWMDGWSPLAVRVGGARDAFLELGRTPASPVSARFAHGQIPAGEVQLAPDTRSWRRRGPPSGRPGGDRGPLPAIDRRGVPAAVEVRPGRLGFPSPEVHGRPPERQGPCPGPRRAPREPGRDSVEVAQALVARSRGAARPRRARARAREGFSWP